MNVRTRSLRDMPTSETERLTRDKFALLAKVGQRKREALAFQDEAIFYSGCVTELLAVTKEAMERLQELSPKGKADPDVARLTLEHTRLMRRLVNYWPPNSASQKRAWNLLDCDGLVTMTEITEDGYVSLSSAQILESVERIIEATKASNPSPSSV